MRKFVIALCVIATIALAGFGIWRLKGEGLQAESRAFIDAAMPAIAARWSKQELLNRASPNFLNVVTEEEFNRLFANLERLGTMVRYDGAEGEAFMTFPAGRAAKTSASYLAKIQTENGEAICQVALVKQNGRWMIEGFHVRAKGAQPSRGA